MAIALIVLTPFGAYQANEQITDPAAIKGVLDSEQAAYVKKISVPDPAPDALAPDAPAADSKPKTRK